MAARSKGAGLGSLACWERGLESQRGHGCMSLVIVVYCQVKVSAPNRSFFQRSPTECGVSECHHESSIMRRSGPNWAVGPR